MTSSDPVVIVATFLDAAGFELASPSMTVAGLPFTFGAVLVGTGVSSDLIIVADTSLEPVERLVRRFTGLGRALDTVKSTRSITIVLVGPRPNAQASDELFKVGRVLNIKDPNDKAAMSNGLAVLLPLDIPAPKDEITDIGEALKFEDFEGADSFTARVVTAARSGTSSVRDLFHKELDQAFTIAETQNSEPPTDHADGASE